MDVLSHFYMDFFQTGQYKAKKGHEIQLNRPIQGLKVGNFLSFAQNCGSKF